MTLAQTHAIMLPLTAVPPHSPSSFCPPFQSIYLHIDTSFEHYTSYLHYTYSQFSQPHATLHLFDYSLPLHCWVPVMYPSVFHICLMDPTISPYFYPPSYLVYLPSLSPLAAHGLLMMSGTSEWFMCLFIFIYSSSQRFAATPALLSKPSYSWILTCVAFIRLDLFPIQYFLGLHIAKRFLSCIVFSAFLKKFLALYLIFISRIRTLPLFIM
jgi:hypothetical protein